MYHNIQQAETSFLLKDFHNTIEFSFKTLCKINKIENIPLNENILDNFSNLRKIKDSKTSEDDLELETISLSFIFQSLFELNQISEAKKLFTTYFPPNKYVPPKLLILLFFNFH
jgi:hypothetical protein